MSTDGPSTSPPLVERVARVEQRVDVLTDDVASLQQAFRILVEEAAREGRPISARAVQLAIRHGETVAMPFAAAPSPPPKNTRTSRGGHALPGKVRTAAARLRMRIARFDAAGSTILASQARAELATLLEQARIDAETTSGDRDAITSTSSSSPLEMPGAAGEPVTNAVTEPGNVTPEPAQRYTIGNVDRNVTDNVTRYSVTPAATRPSEALSGSLPDEEPSVPSHDLAHPASLSLSGDNVTRLPARAHAPARSGARDTDSPELEEPASRPSDASPGVASLVAPATPGQPPGAPEKGDGKTGEKRTDERVWTIVGQCATAWRDERRNVYESGQLADESDLEPPPFAPPTRKNNSGARCLIYDGCKRADNLLRDQGIPKKKGDRYLRSELVVLAFRLFSARPRVLWKDWRDEARSWAEVALARYRGDARAPVPAAPAASRDEKPAKRSNGAQPSFARPGF